MSIQINNFQGTYSGIENFRRKINSRTEAISGKAGASGSQSDFAKIQNGLSAYEAYLYTKNVRSKICTGNPAATLRECLQETDTNRYSINKSDEMPGGWEIYDKVLNNTFIFNPGTTTVQTDCNTGKNYILFKDPFGGLMDVMPVDSELMEALNAKNIPAVPLNASYTVGVNEFTGIEYLKVKGHENGKTWLLISNEEQQQKLQELADVYKEKYPSLVKTDSMAIGMAGAEVAGQAVRTEHGIMTLSCNGLHYMDNDNPLRSWAVMYSADDSDMYKEIIDAMTEGYIMGSDLEEVSVWEKYFTERGLAFERILSDEELELLADK